MIYNIIFFVQIYPLGLMVKIIRLNTKKNVYFSFVVARNDSIDIILGLCLG